MDLTRQSRSLLINSWTAYITLFVNEVHARLHESRVLKTEHHNMPLRICSILLILQCPRVVDSVNDYPHIIFLADCVWYNGPAYSNRQDERSRWHHKSKHRFGSRTIWRCCHCHQFTRQSCGETLFLTATFLITSSSIYCTPLIAVKVGPTIKSITFWESCERMSNYKLSHVRIARLKWAPLCLCLIFGRRRSSVLNFCFLCQCVELANCCSTSMQPTS